MKDRIPEFQAQLQAKTTPEIIAWALEQFGAQVVLSSSMSAEDQVLTDMLLAVRPDAPIFTLDTGRLPQETHDVIQSTQAKYGRSIRIVFPRREDVEEMVNAQGPNLFYASLENRKRCCDVRKVQPLRRELTKFQAWMTGLRREQAVTRTTLPVVEWDEVFGLVKINPLASWSEQEVWAYIREHDVPTNALHEKGYPSIGCAPCTRAVAPGEDIRAGRWWWERPEQKECGLHAKGAHGAS